MPIGLICLYPPAGADFSPLLQLYIYFHASQALSTRLIYIPIHREYWMIYIGPGFLAIVLFGSLTTPLPSPSPASKLSLFLSLPCVSLVELTVVHKIFFFPVLFWGNTPTRRRRRSRSIRRAWEVLTATYLIFSWPSLPPSQHVRSQLVSLCVFFLSESEFVNV